MDERRSGERAPFTAVVRGVTKKVIPHQLKDELGGHDVWTTANGTVILANVGQADLEPAVAAHVADPYHDQPDLRIVAEKAQTDPAFAALARILSIPLS